MVGNVQVGGGAPVVVQSMTNTDTADIDGTVSRWRRWRRAGSELVRITVDRDEAAAAVPHIRDRLAARNVHVPLIGDFHYIGHKLLTDHPACAEALAKYRINPGNVGFGEKRDRQFATMVEVALKNDKPVRIGVNWGSLDQSLLTRMMDENAARRETAVGGRGHAPGDHRLGAAFGRGGGGDRPAGGEDHPVGQGQPGAGPDRRLHGARRQVEVRPPSRADRGRHGLARASSPRRPPWASSCSRASATPSASR